jgi:hypothetical protein
MRMSETLNMVLEYQGASFETLATRAPQDEELF